MLVTDGLAEALQRIKGKYTAGPCERAFLCLQLELCTFVDTGIEFIPDYVAEMAAVTRCVRFIRSSNERMDARLNHMRRNMQHDLSRP